jgi:hypothetical protein
MAIHTGLGFPHHGRVVSFGVIGARQLQNLPGTKSNAEAAALTSFLNNMHYALGNPNLVGIERGSPVFHEQLSFIRGLEGFSPSPGNAVRTVPTGSPFIQTGGTPSTIQE